MTQDFWIAKHPYLETLAYLHAQIETAMFDGPTTAPCIPDWGNYDADFVVGVPLLHSSSSAVDLGPVETIVGSLVDRLCSTPLPGKMTEQIRTLDLELRREPDLASGFIAWLLEDGEFASEYPGLLRYLAWTALSRYLRPLIAAFDTWRDDERWQRSYCPTCGAPPAMAQLVGVDPEHRRLLTCGRCRTHWSYRRIACPFCENKDNRQLAVLAVEGEAGLRIDYCESCNGYLKTYVGEGSEPVLLADWTSVHLDVIARDRGLKRRAASLYEL
jgi:FdhE protein